MRLKFASQPQQPAAIFIELRWPHGVPRPPEPVLMHPSHFLQLGVSVELGKAVALPLVSTAHPAAPAAGLPKVSAADETVPAYFRMRGTRLLSRVTLYRTCHGGVYYCRVGRLPQWALGRSGWQSLSGRRWSGCCRCCITPAAASCGVWTRHRPVASWFVGQRAAVGAP